MIYNNRNESTGKKRYIFKCRHCQIVYNISRTCQDLTENKATQCVKIGCVQSWLQNRKNYSNPIRNTQVIRSQKRTGHFFQYGGSIRHIDYQKKSILIRRLSQHLHRRFITKHFETILIIANYMKKCVASRNMNQLFITNHLVTIIIIGIDDKFVANNIIIFAYIHCVINGSTTGADSARLR